MQKREFLEKLRDNAYLENPDAFMELRIPVIQYFINNCDAVSFTVIDGKSVTIESKWVTLKMPTDDYQFTLINRLFSHLREMFRKEWETLEK